MGGGSFLLFLPASFGLFVRSTGVTSSCAESSSLCCGGFKSIGISSSQEKTHKGSMVQRLGGDGHGYGTELLTTAITQECLGWLPSTTMGRKGLDFSHIYLFYLMCHRRKNQITRKSELPAAVKSVHQWMQAAIQVQLKNGHNCTGFAVIPVL